MDGKFDAIGWPSLVGLLKDISEFVIRFDNIVFSKENSRQNKSPIMAAVLVLIGSALLLVVPTFLFSKPRKTDDGKDCANSNASSSNKSGKSVSSGVSGIVSTSSHASQSIPFSDKGRMDTAAQTPSKLAKVDLDKFTSALRSYGFKVTYVKGKELKSKTIRLNAKGELYWSKDGYIPKILQTDKHRWPVSDMKKAFAGDRNPPSFFLTFGEFENHVLELRMETAGEVKDMVAGFSALIARASVDPNYVINVPSVKYSKQADQSAEGSEYDSSFPLGSPTSSVDSPKHNY